MSTATYLANMVDAETGSTNDYRFDASATLFEEPVDEIVEAFFDYLNAHHYTHEDLRYELNSALRNREHQCVTALGSLLLRKGSIPFMVMISPAPAA